MLLTGATGFVGRQVLAALLLEPVRVRLILRGKSEELENVGDKLESIFYTSDLFAASEEFWADACRNVDTVIHVAWYAAPGKYLYSSLNFDCMIGTAVFARACAKAGINKFVGIGTCFEYDLSLGKLSTETPLNPNTPYGASKVAVFYSLSEYFSTVDVKFAWCRLFYLYGEGEDPGRLVPYIRAKLEQGEEVELSAGNQVRDFIDVRLAGANIVRVALGDRIGPVNICSGIGITVRALAENIADEYGRRDLLRFGARPDNLVDPPCVVGVIERSEK